MNVQNDQADNITLERKYTVAILISLKKLLPTFFSGISPNIWFNFGKFKLNSSIFFFLHLDFILDYMHNLKGYVYPLLAEIYQ